MFVLTIKTVTLFSMMGGQTLRTNEEWMVMSYAQHLAAAARWLEPACRRDGINQRHGDQSG